GPPRVTRLSITEVSSQVDCLLYRSDWVASLLRIVASCDAFLEYMQRVAPPILRPLQLSFLGKPVPRSMPPRNRVPGAVLNRYSCFRADWLEANLDLGGVLRREIRLAPGEHQPFARLPDRNAPDLKRRAVFERREQAASLAGL